jgi:hypothetical protein
MWQPLFQLKSVTCDVEQNYRSSVNYDAIHSIRITITVPRDIVHWKRDLENESNFLQGVSELS